MGSYIDVACALAAKALRAARHNDQPETARMLIALFQFDSPTTEAVPAAVVFWVDALRYHMLGGLGPEVAVQLIGCGVMQAKESGELFVIGSAKADTELRPSLLWASEIIDSRLAMDLPRFERAWDSAPTGKTWGVYVTDLLSCVATTIEATEFGYALREVRFE